MRVSLRGLLLAGGLLFLTATLPAQRMGDYLGDESVLYAETKQLNQFFRRFNGEEGIDGRRFYPQDSLYRDLRLRQKYLNLLFDKHNPKLTADLKDRFIKRVLTEPKLLDFHGGKWFAEVDTRFYYQGKSVPVTLFLQLEETKPGSKWVFINVFFEPFHQIFNKVPNTAQHPAFINPLNHELDFSELIKIFRNNLPLETYAQRDYQPDFLTLFLYEIKNGNLRFQKIQPNGVKFHFFQVDGWYFEVTDLQRRGPNRGWLITQLIDIPPGKQSQLLQFIFRP